MNKCKTSKIVLALYLVSTIAFNRFVLAESSTPVINKFDANEPIEINITNNANISIEKINELKSIINKAVLFFRNHTGEVTNPINIHIGTGTNKLQTGYDLITNSITFVEQKSVINFGLDSIDVINHEVFHAILCGKKPKLCDSLLNVQAKENALHEAFADFFAYLLNPDTCMGENYYSSKPCVRSYSTDLILSLIDGPNVKDIAGNIIVSHLVQEDSKSFGLKEVWEYIQNYKISIDQLSHLSSRIAKELELTQTFAIEDDSILTTGCDKLRRCRFQFGVSYNMTFKPNQSLLNVHPNLQIIWVSGNDNSKPPQGYSITVPTILNPFSFIIEIQENAKIEKAVAGFVSNGKIIGFRTFHFGKALK